MPTGERIKAYGKQAAWVAAGTTAGALSGWLFSSRLQSVTDHSLKTQISCVEDVKNTSDISCIASAIGYDLNQQDVAELSESGYVDQVFADRDALAESITAMFETVEATGGQPNWFLDSELYGAVLGFALSAAVVVRRIPNVDTALTHAQLQAPVVA